MGVHVYLYSDDVLEVDCPQGSGIASGMRKALCHAVSDAHGMFVFRSIPCGNSIYFLFICSIITVSVAFFPHILSVWVLPFCLLLLFD